MKGPFNLPLGGLPSALIEVNVGQRKMGPGCCWCKARDADKLTDLVVVFCVFCVKQTESELRSD